MRERWKRSVPALEPARSQIEAMVRAALPQARVSGVAAVEGGLANTNIRVDLDDRRVLLRLYQHDATQAGKEAAIASLLQGRVPVARFLHVGVLDGQRFAVVEWIDGTDLSAALHDAAGAVVLGRATGEALAAIHAVHFPSQGFLDSALNVASPFGNDETFLTEYLRHALIDGGGARFVPRELADAVVAYAWKNRAAFWGGAPCLVHCDFNGSNILVRDDAIAAVIDWEFAIAGSPSLDFGNLQRNHGDPGFLNGVVDGYRAAGGRLPDDWRKQARLVDLTAWVDFLTRPIVDPTLASDALNAFRATIADD